MPCMYACVYVYIVRTPSKLGVHRGASAGRDWLRSARLRSVCVCVCAGDGHHRPHALSASASAIGLVTVCRWVSKHSGKGRCSWGRQSGGREKVGRVCRAREKERERELLCSRGGVLVHRNFPCRCYAPSFLDVPPSPSPSLFA